MVVPRSRGLRPGLRPERDGPPSHTEPEPESYKWHLLGCHQPNLVVLGGQPPLVGCDRPECRSELQRGWLHPSALVLSVLASRLPTSLDGRKPSRSQVRGDPSCSRLQSPDADWSNRSPGGGHGILQQRSSRPRHPVLVVLDTGVARLQVDQERRSRIDRHGLWVHDSRVLGVSTRSVRDHLEQRQPYICAKSWLARAVKGCIAPLMTPWMRRHWWISAPTARSLPGALGCSPFEACTPSPGFSPPFVVPVEDAVDSKGDLRPKSLGKCMIKVPFS